jgi:hypothetical protein
MTEPGDPQRELPAVVRQGARQIRELYLGLVREGFTEREALTIVGIAMSMGSGGGNQHPPGE